MIELTREEAEELYEYMYQDILGQYDRYYDHYIMPRGQTLEKWCNIWAKSQYELMQKLRSKLDA